ERALVGDVAARGSVELRLPVPTDCARDVARVVSSRVDVDLDQADAGVVEVCGHPVGGDEHFRMSVAHGSLQASNTRQPVSGMGPKKTVGEPDLVPGQSPGDLIEDVGFVALQVGERDTSQQVVEASLAYTPHPR